MLFADIDEIIDGTLEEKPMTDNEIVKAKALIEKLKEAYDFYCDVSKNMPYDIDITVRESRLLIESLLEENKRQKAEIDNLSMALEVTRDNLGDTREALNEAEAEIERFNKIKNAYDFAECIKQEIKAEAAKEFAELLKQEIAQALESNYKARAERMCNTELYAADTFISYCNGKIDCLRGLDGFIDNLLQERLGDTQ